MKLAIRIILIVLLLPALAACGGTAVPEEPVQVESGVDNDDTPNNGEDADSGETHDRDQDTDAGQDSGNDVADNGIVWGDSQTPAQSACDHKELPLREGATWQYESDDGVLNWEVTEVVGDMQEATAQIVISIEDFHFDNSVTCTEAEGIVWTDFSKQGMSEAFPGVVINLEVVDGVFLPPKLSEGLTWEARLQRSFTFNVGEGSSLTEATGKIDMQQSDKVLGSGPITAVGETVDGVQTQKVSEIVLKVDVEGNPFEQNEILTETLDFGMGVGLVRHQVESETASAVWNLTAFQIP